MSETIEPEDQQTKDFEAIKDLLLGGKQVGLTLEVLYEALSQLKSDPNMTISEACYNALWDWDC